MRGGLMDTNDDNLRAVASHVAHGALACVFSLQQNNERQEQRPTLLYGPTLFFGWGRTKRFDRERTPSSCTGSLSLARARSRGPADFPRVG